MTELLIIDLIVTVMIFTAVLFAKTKKDCK